MAYDRFLIAPFDSGLVTALRPWQIPDQAFAQLENAYVFRGRVRKRFGSTLTGTGASSSQTAPLFSRVRVQCGSTTNLGARATTVPGAGGAIGQMFSIGDEIFTVNALGVPANMLTTGVLLGATDIAGALSGTVPGSMGILGQTFIINGVLFTVTVNAPGPQILTRNPAGGTTHTFDMTTGNFVFTGEAIGNSVYFFSVTHTFNTTTGDVIFTGAKPSTPVYFYPNNPIMGLTLYETDDIIDSTAIAFDTQYAYNYTGGAWPMITSSPTWHGSNSQFFWACNYRGATLNASETYITNFNATKDAAPSATDDPMWYYDPSGGFKPFAPQFFVAGDSVRSCRIIIPFHSRLLLLNTIERNAAGNYNSHYPARCRFSHFGAPIASSVAIAGGAGVGITDGTGGATGTVPGASGVMGATFTIGSEVFTVVNVTAGAQVMLTTGSAATHTFDATTGVFVFAGATATTQIYYYANASGAWLENGQIGWDGAGWEDASTTEEIVSAEFIKDRLIVYFERSTWEIVYTGNGAHPFIWQKINTELGAVSTFSAVPFDKFVLTVGNTGIHACSGGNVERIDSKIPQQIFKINNDNNGIYRVHGIRDYAKEMVYWSFPQQGSNTFNGVYPNKVLVYNYKNDSWAVNDDVITCFGEFEQQPDTTWSSATFTWGGTVNEWGSGLLDAEARRVIFGTPEGYILYVAPDSPRNAPSMQITDITATATDTTLVIVNHSLDVGDYIFVENDKTELKLHPVAGEYIYQVQSVTDANTVSIGTVGLFSTYTGGATAARVSNIYIQSKQWNPYVDKGMNVSIGKIDFGVQKTDNGQVYVDYSLSSSNISMVTDAVGSSVILGDQNILETSAYTDYPLEATQDRIWHTIYFQGTGECIQILITMSPEQMLYPSMSMEDFQLEGIVLYTNPTGRLQ